MPQPDPCRTARLFFALMRLSMILGEEETRPRGPREGAPHGFSTRATVPRQ